VTQIAQTGQGGLSPTVPCNAVADKRVSFSYADNGQLLAIQRYQADQLVAASQYTYGALGQLAALVHAQGSTTLASYSFIYAGAQEGQATAYSLVSAEDICWLPSPGVDTSGIVQALIEQAREGRASLTGVTSNDGTVTYTYDPTGQLTAATYSSSNSQSPIPNPSESYVYDLNGNRVSVASGSSSSTYVIGAGNRLISDGTCTYSYDAEGNRTARWTDVDADGVLDAGDTDVTEYTWDNRNRLVKVTDYATFGGDAVQIVGYSYDVQNRWIGETVDSDGDGDVDHATRFVYDGQQIVLQFEGNPTSDIQNPTSLQLTHRYLWGQAVDQLLADEQIPAAAHGEGGEGQSTSSATTAPGNVLWALSDQLGTVRDLAQIDAATGLTQVVNHRVYDSFGQLTSETNAAVDCLFGFTGRPTDAATGLRNHVNRWADPGTGDWLSEDPTMFNARDTNTRRYCCNSPANMTDPTGLWGVGQGTNGTWTPDQVQRTFGHSDFYNPDGLFDFNTEDTGWTRPENPFRTWLHFQTFGETQILLRKALDNHDKDAFERAMHDMQDYFSHRKQGWEAWNEDIALMGAEVGARVGSLIGPWSTLAGAGIGASAGWGHTWASVRAKAGYGLTPDDAIDYKDDFIAANEWTTEWVDRWRTRWGNN